MQVICTENYRVVSPFGEGSLGTLQVEQTLQAVGIANAGQQELFKDRLSLIFDHKNDNFHGRNSPQFVKKIIDELCEANDRVNPDVSIRGKSFPFLPDIT